MTSKKLYLVCNAHLDPVWLWEWEEGAAEALSTFRTAVQLCEEFEGFVFCHNESLLYGWVEMYDPELFVKIQKMVSRGRWHIMGGWYVQPDCNMPSGESLVRQILIGRNYFAKKFGSNPETAINFDPFGHTRGLVQILKKSGYTSYLFCRPDAHELELPADDFIWIGYDGSTILAHRARHHYNSQKGKAGKKTEEWLAGNVERVTGLLLWGIGNHGGGASREDLLALRKLMASTKDRDILHATPEAYFDELKPNQDLYPKWEKDLNPWAVGCYTSMALVKQKHRLLENTYFKTEKMATHVSLEGLMTYPKKELQKALEDLLFCQFHDILPGSSIPEVEEDVLRKIGHGLEILSQIKMRAFFRLLGGQARAEEGEFPVLVYNPHPFSVTTTIVCEFQPPEPNTDPDIFLMPEMEDESGNEIPLQLEQESSNISVDMRKRIVFLADLKPSQMNRYTCRLKTVDPPPGLKAANDSTFNLKTDSLEVSLDPETGYMDKYAVNGEDFLKAGSFRLLVCKDNPDPWGMLVRSFREVEGVFTLLSGERSAWFSGVSVKELPPVRIVENGPVRTVIEAVFQYNSSYACVTYVLPKKGTELEFKIRVQWNERDRMLKLSVPSMFTKGTCRGQVAYGVEEFERFGEELVAQKWVAAVSSDKLKALTVINSGTYGFDFSEGELRLSLLRSPSYAGHPVESKSIVPQNRFRPRIDLGERMFQFWIKGGNADGLLSGIDRSALVKNETPFALCCFPSGEGKGHTPGIILSENVVQLASFKMAENENRLVLRLFEPTGKKRSTHVDIPSLNLSFEVSLKKFEIKTFAIDIKTKEIIETDLLERSLNEED